MTIARRSAQRFLVLGAAAAMLLLAADRPGVSPRAASKDYPVSDHSGGVTIAAVLLPPGKAQRQFAPEVARAGYLVLEVAIYPDRGKTADISPKDFSLLADPDSAPVFPDTPAEVVTQVLATAGPRALSSTSSGPSRVQTTTTDTIGVTSGGYDPTTGRRYPAGVYTGTGVGVGNGGPATDPRLGDPRAGDPTLNSRYPDDPLNRPDLGPPTVPPAPQQKSLREILEQKALPQGHVSKPVAGYLYFLNNAPRLKNSAAPYQLTYSGPAGEFHLSVPAK